VQDAACWGREGRGLTMWCVTGASAGLACELSAGRNHRFGSVVDGLDDLGVVDAA
jgi:hypothetical protein